MLTVIVERPNVCDIVRIDARNYAAFVYSLLMCCRESRCWVQNSANILPAIIVRKAG